MYCVCICLCLMIQRIVVLPDVMVSLFRVVGWCYLWLLLTAIRNVCICVVFANIYSYVGSSKIINKLMFVLPLPLTLQHWLDSCYPICYRMYCGIHNHNNYCVLWQVCIMYVYEPVSVPFTTRAIRSSLSASKSLILLGCRI